MTNVNETLKMIYQVVFKVSISSGSIPFSLFGRASYILEKARKLENFKITPYKSLPS